VYICPYFIFLHTLLIYIFFYHILASSSFLYPIYHVNLWKCFLITDITFAIQYYSWFMLEELFSVEISWTWWFFSKSVMNILIENNDTRETVTRVVIRTSSNISRQQHFSITYHSFLLLAMPKEQVVLFMHIRCLFPFLVLFFVYLFIFYFIFLFFLFFWFYFSFVFCFTLFCNFLSTYHFNK
jgi:hypothetical protein